MHALSELLPTFAGSNHRTYHLLKVDLSDPLRAFFMVRRDRFDGRLHFRAWFKILLDIIVTSRGKLRPVEIPYVFLARSYGQSKLASLVALDFVGLVILRHHEMLELSSSRRERFILCR